MKKPAAMAVAMVLAVLLCAFGRASALYAPTSDVVQLTSSNFKNKVRCQIFFLFLLLIGRNAGSVTSRLL